MKPRMVIVALAALAGVAFTTGGACAMPNGIPQAGQIAGASANVEYVRWVCPPGGRCFWRPGRPGWRGSFGMGPRPVRRPWRRDWGPRGRR